MPLLPLASALLLLLAGVACALHFHPVGGHDAAHARLARAKRVPALLLVGMAAGFVATFALPWPFAAGLLRAGCEAGMVGAIADWVAVSALFRRIPGVRESDLIARQKDVIGDELAQFVQARFLDPGSLVALIRRHDVAATVARWLAQDANTQQVAAVLRRFVAGLLQVVGEEPVLQLMKKAARSYVTTLDPAPALAKVLEPLTARGQHQQLLDLALERLLDFLERIETREMLAQAIVQWLRTEHRWKQRVLPTQWIGDKGSAIVAERLGAFLAEVCRDPAHEFRAGFNRQVESWVAQLQDDPHTRRWWRITVRGLFDDELLTRFVGAQWSAFSEWLEQDLARPGSALERNLATAAAWLGQELADDAALRATLNAQLEAAAHGLAPGFAEFLSGHIRQTVHGWDAREMATLVELALGPRLQKIRINGTCLGFLLGVLLFLAAWGLEGWLAP